MTFEKIDNNNVLTPTSGCSGCSNNGQSVYSGYYSEQQKSARECNTSSPTS